MDKLVTIEYPVITQDAYGAAIKTWLPLVSIGSPPVAVKLWAEVQDVLPSRSEAVRQGLDMARNQSRLRMRYRSDLTSDMRITLHQETDTIYNIVGGPAIIGGRKQMLEMVIEKFSS